MKPFERNVSSKYGAPMGRHSDNPANFDGIKVHLCRIPMVDGDYDAGGAYWGGSNPPMWCAWSDEEDLVFYTRAKNREEAKRELPGAKYYK